MVRLKHQINAIEGKVAVFGHESTAAFLTRPKGAPLPVFDRQTRTYRYHSGVGEAVFALDGYLD